jgi:hypothetical protein
MDDPVLKNPNMLDNQRSETIGVAVAQRLDNAVVLIDYGCIVPLQIPFGVDFITKREIGQPVVSQRTFCKLRT